ncbi:acyltransferase [Bradyrhizobium sp. Arg237L]|uniref:acyltransferase family protein n=1 Tax=Bradyrhizobium sp. Arg237L TaxID=3003352 RepID=UPI00249E514F|nr:acyltransferase [Bradyrhizobium sp. Arg237L]MDI4234926.1 acyltransferase [Bradyrhizobium sp. Arg237L]
MQKTTNAIRHLDSLRIIAACAVVILHYSDYFRDLPLGRIIIAHLWHFNLFVDLFFVVSGFVIARQYFDHVGDGAAIGRFLWRRVARIYPLHLATLTFYICIALALSFGMARSDNPARYSFSDLPAQFLLLHAFVGERLTFNFPSWSLSAEMFCYLLFPLIVALTLRRKTLIIAIVALSALANSVWVATMETLPWSEWINEGGAFRAVAAFSLGIACSVYRDQIARWPAMRGALILALGAFTLFGSWLTPMAALVTVYVIAVLAIQLDCSGSDTLLSMLRLDRFAPLTYSSYMLHMPIATVIITLDSRLVLFASSEAKLILAPVSFIVLGITSVLSYRCFETPARRYLTDLYDRRFVKAVAAPISQREIA